MRKGRKASMADIEKVIKGLECCTKLGCHHGCEYKPNGYSAMICRQKLETDALELLKEQQAIIRCKDCKYGYKDEASKSLGTVQCAKMDCFKLDNWFCADGERKK